MLKSFILGLLLLLGGASMAMELKSNAFANGNTIPSQYTCDGDDLWPDLSWSRAPDKTKSFVLIMEDPDAPAGVWVHWILFNIPNSIQTIPAGAKSAQLTAIEGKNSWGKTGYGGPCPPSGSHRYIFTLYALDTSLTLSKGATKQEIENAMQNHILEKTTLMGKYSRSTTR